MKPATFDGYSDPYTEDCERVLVTLLRGLGPWKESVYLIGDLRPGISSPPGLQKCQRTQALWMWTS